MAQLAAGAVLGADRSPPTPDDGHLLAAGLLALVATVVLGSWHLPAGSVTFERRTRVLVGALLTAAGWLPSISALEAAVPGALCWVSVVRTGRQHWRDSPAAEMAPVPHPRRPLVPERTARRSGT